jgi:hypothetical protein
MIGFPPCGVDSAAVSAEAGAVAVDKRSPFGDGIDVSNVTHGATRLATVVDAASADIGVLYLQTLQFYISASLRQLQSLESGKILPGEYGKGVEPDLLESGTFPVTSGE